MDNRPYLHLLLHMLMLEDSWQTHRIVKAIKGTQLKTQLKYPAQIPSSNTQLKYPAQIPSSKTQLKPQLYESLLNVSDP
jgi:hypothetical protein